MGEKIYMAFYELSRLVIDCLLLNLLWGIVSWPVLFLMIQVGVTPDPEALQILLPLLFLFMQSFYFQVCRHLFPLSGRGLENPFLQDPLVSSSITEMATETAS
ncbi:hypothetical protein [Alkalibacterium sp. m-11]